MGTRAVGYLRRHHLALLAIFVALGGTGAYAATSSNAPHTRGFAATPTGSSSGTLATVDGVTLRWKSVNHPDERVCTFSLRAARAGELATFSGDKRDATPLTQSVTSKQLGPHGSAQIATARFEPGAPGLAEHIEGQLTFGDKAHTSEVTAIFHVAGEQGHCLFEGTVTAAR